MRLSLIVATYNRADRLQPMLLSLLNQSALAEVWEAIIVNNNSSDNTIEVVENFIATHNCVNISLVTEREQGLSHARNCGIESSKSPLIAIIDDDEQIESTYIQSYIDFFDTHANVAAAGGAIIAKYEGERPSWLSHFVEIPIANPIGESSVAHPFPSNKIPGGGNMAIRRSVIERYGAFDPALGRTGERLIGGEESNLFDRLRRGGEQVWFVPRAAIYHNIGAEKLERSYLNRLWYNIGVSQRLRSRIEGVSGFHLVVREALKWGVTLSLSLFYLLTFRPSKGLYLILMRFNISRGILSRTSS